MSDEIILQGKRYKLVPVEDDSILDDYLLESDRQNRPGTPEAQSEESQAVKDAVPTVSDYRERYKTRKLTRADVTVAPKIIEVENKADSMLEGYSYKGEGLFFGEGLTQDI